MLGFIQTLTTMKDTLSLLLWRVCNINPGKTLNFNVDFNSTLTHMLPVLSNILRVGEAKEGLQRIFLSHKFGLIMLTIVTANALLISTCKMALMRLRITSRTPWMEVEMRLQRED